MRQGMRRALGVRLAVFAGCVALALAGARVACGEGGCSAGDAIWVCHPYLDVQGSGLQGVLAGVCGARLLPPCADEYFCPGELVTREDAAFSLERGIQRHGNHDVGSGAGLYADMPAGYCLGGFVEQGLRDGLLASCGATTACPGVPLTRAKAAEAMARAVVYPFKQSDWPYQPCSERPFPDVLVTHPQCPFISYVSGLVGTDPGVCPSTCQNAPCFCPDAPLRRESWARWLWAAFAQQLAGPAFTVTPSQGQVGTEITLTPTSGAFTEPVMVAVDGALVPYMPVTPQGTLVFPAPAHGRRTVWGAPGWAESGTARNPTTGRASRVGGAGAPFGACGGVLQTRWPRARGAQKEPLSGGQTARPAGPAVT
jgi:hypothetical protein